MSHSAVEPAYGDTITLDEYLRTRGIVITDEIAAEARRELAIPRDDED